MINKVIMTGRLTKDIELKYTASGKAVATFTLAVNRKFTNQSGEREADYIQCVIWGKSAEAMAKYTRKGSLVGIEGRVNTRSYENQQGMRVYITEVIVENFSMLESKEANVKRMQEQVMVAEDATYSSDVGSWQDNEIRDEDMPF